MVFEAANGTIERRVGPFGRTVLSAYRAAVAAIARAGLDVIVDEVLLSEEDWEGWQRDLAGLDVTWVAVDLAPDLLLERERARGDRVIGMAAAQVDVVHSYATYDLGVDTGVLTPEDAAAAIHARISGA
jgi:chloramphenicol 3-O phosphotransferase